MLSPRFPRSLSLIAALSMLLTAPAVAETVDLRNMSEPAGIWHTIDICARPKDAQGQGVGHAFVVFRSHSREFLAVGYGPEAEKGTVLPVDGVVQAENFSHAGQRCLTAKVTTDQYQALRRKVDADTLIRIGDIEIPVRSRYFLVWNDCVTFMQATATYLGLEVPARITNLTPMQMVKALIDANT